MSSAPKKAFGQNFLNSQAAIFKMAEAASVSASDVVLEIGPGKGALTKELLSRGASVVAIEKDTELIPHLTELFSSEISSGRFTVIVGDILSFDDASLAELLGIPYKVVANIPYYITNAIIEKFLSTKHKPSSMTLLVQKEVADRIMVRDKKQSILSIAIAAYCTPYFISTVKAGSFFPAPKVDSAIVLFEGINDTLFKGDPLEEHRFFQVVKAAFAHKRKLMLGNLIEKGIGSREKIQNAFTYAGINPSTRAETLTAEDFKRLADCL